MGAFRQEYVGGKVVDKYTFNNSNLGLIVEEAAIHMGCQGEFKDNCKGPGAGNLFGP